MGPSRLGGSILFLLVLGALGILLHMSKEMGLIEGLFEVASNREAITHSVCRRYHLVLLVKMGGDHCFEEHP